MSLPTWIDDVYLEVELTVNWVSGINRVFRFSEVK